MSNSGRLTHSFGFCFGLTFGGCASDMSDSCGLAGCFALCHRLCFTGGLTLGRMGDRGGFTFCLSFGLCVRLAGGLTFRGVSDC